MRRLAGLAAGLWLLSIATIGLATGLGRWLPGDQLLAHFVQPSQSSDTSLGIHLIDVSRGLLYPLVHRCASGQSLMWPVSQEAAFMQAGTLCVVSQRTGRAIERVPVPAALYADDAHFVSAASQPGDRRIAFEVVHDSPATYGDVYILDRQSGETYNLTPDNSAYGRPQWSPDGNYLAFAVQSQSAIAVYDMRTYQQINLLRYPEAGRVYLDWSPDSRRLAIATEMDGTLRVLAVSSGVQHKLARQLAGSPHLYWSPDSRLIAYQGTDSAQNTFMFTVDSQTGIQENWTRGLDAMRAESAVWWSPTGDQIAFFIWRDNHRYLHVFDLQSQSRHNAIYQGEQIQQIEWLPDGRQIAIQVYDGTNSGFYLLDANTSQGAYFDGYYSGLESWSPDMGRVALLSQSARNQQNLHILELDTRQRTPLPQQTVHYTHLAWIR